MSRCRSSMFLVVMICVFRLRVAIEANQVDELNFRHRLPSKG